MSACRSSTDDQRNDKRGRTARPPCENVSAVSQCDNVRLWRGEADNT